MTSNADTVVLRLNGRTIGEAQSIASTVSWTVPYAPDRGDRPSRQPRSRARHCAQTVGSRCAGLPTPARGKMAAGGGRRPLSLRSTGSAARPRCRLPRHFTVRGRHDVGVGNGDPSGRAPPGARASPRAPFESSCDAGYGTGSLLVTRRAVSLRAALATTTVEGGAHASASGVNDLGLAALAASVNAPIALAARRNAQALVHQGRQRPPDAEPGWRIYRRDRHPRRAVRHAGGTCGSPR